MKTGGTSDYFIEQKYNAEKPNQIWKASTLNKKTFKGEELLKEKEQTIYTGWETKGTNKSSLKNTNREFYEPNERGI